jgi:hypothetical protein
MPCLPLHVERVNAVAKIEAMASLYSADKYLRLKKRVLLHVTFMQLDVLMCRSSYEWLRCYEIPGMASLTLAAVQPVTTPAKSGIRRGLMRCLTMIILIDSPCAAMAVYF